MDEPAIDDELMQMGTEDAFGWLLQQFKDYSHGKLIWVDLRKVIKTADALQAKFAAKDQEPESVEEIEMVA